MGTPTAIKTNVFFAGTHLQLAGKLWSKKK